MGPLVCGQSAVAGTSGNSLRIGPYSEAVGPRHALIGARVDVSRERVVHSSGPSKRPSIRATTVPPSARPSYPLIEANAPLLRNPHPFGAHSFWYAHGSGQPCIYAPDTSSTCYTVVASAGGGGRMQPPALLAASAVRRLDLVPRVIEASPSRTGLTGAASWFWLDPPP
jgi:hypothetical protein